MSGTPAPSAMTTTVAPGGNAYVGPSLTRSLVRFVAALATAGR